MIGRRSKKILTKTKMSDMRNNGFPSKKSKSLGLKIFVALAFVAIVVAAVIVVPKTTFFQGSSFGDLSVYEEDRTSELPLPPPTSETDDGDEAEITLIDFGAETPEEDVVVSPIPVDDGDESVQIVDYTVSTDSTDTALDEDGNPIPVAVDSDPIEFSDESGEITYELAPSKLTVGSVGVSPAIVGDDDKTEVTLIDRGADAVADEEEAVVVSPAPVDDDEEEALVVSP